jgi:hypothetical protein
MTEIDATGSMAVLLAAGRLLRPGCSEGEALRVLIDFLISPGAVLADAQADPTERVRGLLRGADLSGGVQRSDDAVWVAARVLLVFAEAVALFGNEVAAWNWWTTPLQRSEGVPPVPPSEIAHDVAGAVELVGRIRRTAQGIY